MKEFIPVADEVHWLQSHDGPEARLFQKIAEQGHYGGRDKPTSTRQGIYATAPNGTFLASINTNDPKQLAGMMREALTKWRELKTDERTFDEFPNGTGRKRGELRIPPDGLVLKVNSRDLPRDDLPDGDARDDDTRDDWRGAFWNQDFAWFTKQEASQFFTPKLSAEKAVPAAIVKRLARLHLLDNVRGQTWPPYSEKNVRRARLQSKVTAIAGDLVSLRLEGETRCTAKGGWSSPGWEDISQRERGVETKLLGSAVYDLKQEAFVQFELVAIGSRWGATQYNARRDDLGPAPIGFVFTLAGKRAADKVAPAFWSSYPDW
ncbi:MAG: hypothetical protein WBF93_02865 [Pirellulales bacterium]